jgi:hypothetical protein
MPVVLPLWQANRRAVRLAAKWDRPPVEKHAPLTGQVFLTLQGGSISVHELPAAMDGRSPSLHVQAGEVTIGLVCQSDTWDGTVYGDGIRGRVLAQVHKGRDYSLSLRVKGVPGIIGREPASAEYTIDLTRNDTHFAGTFSGTYNGHPARGTALGYLYRPVATVRL